MGTETPNHSFFKPAIDETGWGTEKNTDWDDLDTGVVIKDTLANRPTAGTAGRWFLATDTLDLFYDDGASWNDVLASVGDAATLDGNDSPYYLDHANFTNVGTADHHAKYTDEEAQDALGLIADGTLTYDDVTPSIGVADSSIGPTQLSFDPATQAELDTHAGSAGAHHSRPTAGTGLEETGGTFNMDVAASGQVTLSAGEATVDTAVSAVDATFMLALGVDDPDADCEVAGRLFWDDSAGTYHAKIVEQETSVGTPTVNYDVVRVR